uniref:GPR180/TMEM145 transmembrane domain-containing protein n=1 Tax=Strigamia maritima TaxID=126957 RepID=T1JGC1_STRMM
MFRQLCILLLVTTFTNVLGLHVKGTWKTREPFLFVAKFGFQKTNNFDKSNTQGYIFGNVTTRTNFSHPLTFVVADKTYFIDFYKNRMQLFNAKQNACQEMFKVINTIAYDAQCFDDGVEDFLRKIPCPDGKICTDEDVPDRVVPGFQFTYGIQDLEPRFWYLSMVSCYRNSCSWTSDPTLDIEIDFDIWLVNGNPFNNHHNPFKYQFSFDRQDCAVIYVIFLILYWVLVPIQICAVMRQKHLITRLFTLSLLLEPVGILFNVIHNVTFAFNGEGNVSLSVLGDIMDILSQVTRITNDHTFFMLLLLLLAKGWAITSQELIHKFILFFVWSIYLCVNIMLYVWNKTEVDVIQDIDEYQTWPGGLSLLIRLSIMAWFLFELRTTMLYEHNKQKLQFFLHFGASSLVWFVYLPLLVLIAIHISALWRFKLMLGIMYSVDFVAFAVMTHLLWPTRSEQYFQLSSETDITEELEEFNEAPHIVNGQNGKCTNPRI